MRFAETDGEDRIPRVSSQAFLDTSLSSREKKRIRRPIETASFFESDGSKSRMVSTDGHRLSKVERTIAVQAFAGAVQCRDAHRGVLVGEAPRWIDGAKRPGGATSPAVRTGPSDGVGCGAAPGGTAASQIEPELRRAARAQAVV